MTYSRHIQLFSLAFLLLLVSWHSTVLHMANIVWSVDVFSHGLLVPIVSAVLIWSRRETLASVSPVFSPLGTLIVLSACFLWLFGELIDIALFSHVALITAVNGLTIAILGCRFYQAILFPMLFLFLTVPFGYELIAPLQTMTANLVIGVLDLIGADYEATGVMIKLSSGLYEVAEACAGVKFLFTSFVTGVLLAHLVFESWNRRVLILVISVLLPIAANALRVLGILAIAEMTDQAFAKDVDHVVYGWVFLSIVLFALIAFAYRISDKPAVPEATDVIEHSDEAGSQYIAIGVLALLLPVLFSLVPPSPEEPVYTEGEIELQSLFVKAPAGYRILNNANSVSAPFFRDASIRRSTTLRRNDTVFLASYARVEGLAGGRRLFHPANSLAGPRWLEMRGVDDGRTGKCGSVFNEFILHSGENRMLIWAFYFVNGTSVTSGFKEKAETAMAYILRKPVIGEIFILSALADNNVEDERAIFTSFLSTFSSDGLLLSPGGTNLRDSIVCAG